MNPIRSFGAALVLAALSLVTAAAQAGTGNLYSVTSKMEIVGMPFQMPAQTAEVCGPKDQASEKMVPRDKDCTVSDFRVVGNKSTFNMACRGQNPMTAKGEFEQISADAYRGRMQMQGKMEGEPMDMTMTFEGRKVRECDYATESPEAKGKAMLAQSCGQILSVPGNPYLSYESFIGPNAICAADKAKFCGRVTPIAGDPAALRQADGIDKQMRDSGAPGSLWQALQGCGLPRATVMKTACARAEAIPDYEFIGDLCPSAIARSCTKANAATAPNFVARHCPAQAAELAKIHCVSRGFTADLGNAYTGFCNAYATQHLRDGRQDGSEAAPGTTPTTTPPPAEEKKKSWLDRARDAIGG